MLDFWLTQPPHKRSSAPHNSPPARNDANPPANALEGFFVLPVLSFRTEGRNLTGLNPCLRLIALALNLLQDPTLEDKQNKSPPRTGDFLSIKIQALLQRPLGEFRRGDRGLRDIGWHVMAIFRKSHDLIHGFHSFDNLAPNGVLIV